MKKQRGMDFYASSNLLTLPFDYWDLRKAARDGFEQEDRRFYWPHIVTFPPKSPVAVLPNTPLVAQRMYDRFLALSVHTSSKLNKAALSSNGDDKGMLSSVTVNDVVVDVMEAICAHYPVNLPGLLEPLVKLVAPVLNNSAVCFYFFCSYMDKSYWYSIPNITAHRYKLNTFRTLCQRCMKNTYASLVDIGALEEPHLSMIFVTYFTKLLPIKFVYRVLDMYFVEGYKILYRFGLALIKIYKGRIKSGEFKTGHDFWNAVIFDATLPNFDFQPIFNFAFDIRPVNFLKISVVPKRAILQKLEKETRSVMTTEELTAPLQQEFETSLDERHTFSKADSAIYLHMKSSILNQEMAERLHAHLSPAAQMEGFDLVFSTYNDGWSLHSLYEKTRNLFPCLIIIRTIESSNDTTIGMYMSCAISPPSRSVRGDGLCFCFRLDSENPQCYRWVGHVEDSVEILPSTKVQFAICSVDYMSFGGSAAHGTNAIRLSSDLMNCTTGFSDTYCNPPLVTDGVQAGGNSLKVGDVEVFCGKMSVAKYHGHSSSR